MITILEDANCYAEIRNEIYELPLSEKDSAEDRLANLFENMDLDDVMHELKNNGEFLNALSICLRDLNRSNRQASKLEKEEIQIRMNEALMYG